LTNIKKWWLSSGYWQYNNKFLSVPSLFLKWGLNLEFLFVVTTSLRGKRKFPSYTCIMMEGFLLKAFSVSKWKWVSQNNLLEQHLTDGILKIGRGLMGKAYNEPAIRLTFWTDAPKNFLPDFCKHRFISSTVSFYLLR
jgi:hypothetical protein